MSSRKNKKNRQLEKLITSEQKNAAVKPAKTDSSKKSSSVWQDAEKPLYTVLFLVAAIAVLSFVFRLIMNSVVTDICTKADPSLANNVEALKEAASAYIESHPVFTVISRMTISLAVIAALVFFFPMIEDTTHSSLGLRKTLQTGADLGLGSIFGIVSVFLIFNIFILLGYAGITGDLVFNYYEIIWGIDIILTCIFEELFFRGYLIFKLKKYGTVLTMIVTSLLFTLFKGIPSTAIPTYLTFFAMGMFLSWTTLRFSSIWFAFTFRLFWTLISGIVLPVYSAAVPGIVELEFFKEGFLSGTKAGFENGFLATIIILACFFTVKYIADRKKNETKQRRLHSDGTIH